jgi:predicted dehydrogenase
MIGFGVVGCGYWGPNLIRNFAKVPGGKLIAVADTDAQRLETIRKQYPSVRLYRNSHEMFAASDIQAVAIATPVSTHFALAADALSCGKHVLVEKPITSNLAQAADLLQMAESRELVLMTDHTFVYSGAVRKIRELLDSGALGNIYYYDSVRVNLGLFQADVNVLWDLAPHDLAIMCYLINKKPTSVSAVGARPVKMEGWDRESVAYVSVKFEDETIAHFHVNWLSPVKVRRTLIGCSRKMVMYDHLDPDNQIKIFDKGLDLDGDNQRYNALVQYRMGDMWAPKIDQTEALEVLCNHFVDCIETGKPPITGGREGMRVVQILESAQESLKSNGTAVKI